MRRTAAALLVVLGIAGCGAEDDEPVEPAVVTSAVDATRAAGGVRIRMVATIAPEAGDGVGEHATISGVADLRRHAGRFKLANPELADVYEQATGRPTDPADFAGDLILLGPAIFVRLPVLSEQAGEGKPWVLQTTSQARIGAEGVDFSHLARVNGNDVAQTFEDLRHARDVSRLEDEDEVAGVRTAHYRATVDLGETEDAHGFESLTGSTEYPVELWIDDRGLIRKFRMTTTPKLATASPNRVQDGRIDLEAVVEEVGLTVRVKAPPEEDVAVRDPEGGLSPP